jgi:hypothetical protein
MSRYDPDRELPDEQETVGPNAPIARPPPTPRGRPDETSCYLEQRTGNQST